MRIVVYDLNAAFLRPVKLIQWPYIQLSLTDLRRSPSLISKLLMLDSAAAAHRVAFRVLRLLRTVANGVAMGLSISSPAFP